MKAWQGVETLGVHVWVWLEGIREGTRHLSTMGRRILAGFLWYVILQKVHCQHGDPHQHQQASFTAEEINQASFDSILAPRSRRTPS